MARVITYECTECGSEIVVTETMETVRSPIFCCGFEVAEVGSEEKKQSRPKKAVQKATKKGPAKKVAPKKKPAAKKKSPKKK